MKCFEKKEAVFLKINTSDLTFAIDIHSAHEFKTLRNTAVNHDRAFQMHL